MPPLQKLRQLQPRDTPLSQRLFSVLRHLQSARPHYAPVVVATPDSAAEVRATDRLVEDRVGGDMSYVDFVCHVHREIRERVLKL